MFYKHLAKVKLHHERGKKLTVYGTQAGPNDASFMLSNQEIVITDLQLKKFITQN
jgi:hypothetical protein